MDQPFGIAHGGIDAGTQSAPGRGHVQPGGGPRGGGVQTWHVERVGSDSPAACRREYSAFPTAGRAPEDCVGAGHHHPSLSEPPNMGAGAKDPGPTKLRELAVMVKKMTSADDPEALVYAFERTTSVARWPEDQWMAVLILCLIGLAQQAIDTLPPGDLADYEKVQPAILQTLNRSPKAYLRCLRQREFRPDYHPHLTVQKSGGLACSGCIWKC